MMSAAHVLAHQGGWDEILMVAGPLLVFAGVLYMANKRANAKLAAAAAAPAADDDQDVQESSRS